MNWLTVLSSASNTFNANGALVLLSLIGVTADWSVSIFFGILKITQNEKWLPVPTWLVTLSSPPISSTNSFDTDRPSPVPPYCLVVEPSACTNDSKIRCWSSLGTPMPVSLTVKRNSTASVIFWTTWSVTVTLPRLVNLIAFERRFKRIWLSRFGSPVMACGRLSPSFDTNCNPLDSAESRINADASWTTLTGSMVIESSTSFPALSFEKSRISLILCKRICAELDITSRYFSCNSGDFFIFIISSVPINPFSGVRSSWLTFATNWLLARSALSAFILASASSSARRRRSLLLFKLFQ